MLSHNIIQTLRDMIDGCCDPAYIADKTGKIILGNSAWDTARAIVDSDDCCYFVNTLTVLIESSHQFGNVAASIKNCLLDGPRYLPVYVYPIHNSSLPHPLFLTVVRNPGPQMRMTMIIERMKLAYGVKTDARLACLLGVNRSAVALARRRGVPSDWLVYVYMKCGVSIEWLYTGEGSPRS